MKRLFPSLLFFLWAGSCFAQNNSLDYFINTALTNNPDFRNFEGQLYSLSLDSQLIRARLKPQLSGISNNSYYPIVRGWGYDEVITNGQQVSGIISLNKSFLSRQNIQTQMATLQIQGQSLSNTLNISRQDIRKAVTDQYLLTYGEQLQLEINASINNLLQKEDSLLKQLTQDNVFKQSEYLAFVVTLQQQFLNYAQLDVQYRFDYTTLNYLAGIVDTTIVPLQDPQLSFNATMNPATSIFYRQYVLDSIKLANDRAVIDQAYRPSITAFADAGYNSSLTYRPYKNFGTGIGLNLNIPIYDGKQRKLQYSKIEIQEKERIRKRDYFINQRKQQVLQLIQQLKATDNLIAQISKQVKYTETLISVNERLLATGDIRLVDFILTLNNYFTAKNLVNQNYINRLKIINQLNYWEQ